MEVPGRRRRTGESGPYRAAYRAAHETGSLRQRIARAREALEECRLCPRSCGVDRSADEPGVCRAGRLARVSSAFAHFGEEDCLRGRSGSGTIFFSWCNLRCVFCQNSDLSWGGEGREMTAREISCLMLDLQRRGCHNINLVTPGHVVPQILEALDLAAAEGLRVPVVYNTSGYDSLTPLELLDGLVDIYMPDFKFWEPEVAGRLAQAEDYPKVARTAIREMHRQVGDLVLDERGVALRGLLVRHLVLPDGMAGTRQVMRFLAREISPDTYVNIMGQYRPAGPLLGDPERYRAMSRTLARSELREARRVAREEGLRRFDRPGGYDLLGL